MRGMLVSALAAAAIVSPAMAQTPTPLAARANDLVKFFNGATPPEGLFAPSFLTVVPSDKLRAGMAQLGAVVGPATAVTVVSVTDSTSARLKLKFAHGTADGTLAIDSAAPNLITGLYITNLQSDGQSPDQVVQALRTLPGHTAFLFARLDEDGPQPIVALNADQPIALGSAFKLVILAELIRETAAGERQWSDTIQLAGQELPAGTYTKMPAGTRVSLLELAQKMISISDNSATDVLLMTLGRAKVEAMMPVIGWQSAARNRPFLTTLETFKVKAKPQFRNWPTLDEKGKRALLKQVDATHYTDADEAAFSPNKPLAIEQVEYFASPADLARTMDWLRKHTESGPGAQGRAILGINPGVIRGPGNAQWSYIGFKGGSEPGVITLTYLLQGKRGWYVISSGWNNSAAGIDEDQFFGLVSGAITASGQ